MKKITAIAAMILVIFCGTSAFAETPPVSTMTVAVSELVPFRVWIFPGVVDGVQVSGHYEYFDMYMDTGKTQEVLEAPTVEPVLKALPVTMGTAPAVQ
ncbi:MAG: hypothetical protein PHG70_07450 [Synergistaceae bacterium]|jgi:hypothetical protein|nr:hypothetical protein [Synergistaceae bacterium]NCB71912.1 hypothetical protein [Clostridia bacterium]